MENVIFLVSNIRPGVKEEGGSNPHQEIPGATSPLPPPPLPRDFLQVVNNAKNGHGLHTRATRENVRTENENEMILKRKCLL